MQVFWTVKLHGSDSGTGFLNSNFFKIQIGNYPTLQFPEIPALIVWLCFYRMDTIEKDRKKKRFEELTTPVLLGVEVDFEDFLEFRLLLGTSAGLESSTSCSRAKYRESFVYAAIGVWTIVGLPMPAMGFSNTALAAFLKHEKRSCEDGLSRMAFLVLSSASRFSTCSQQRAKWWWDDWRFCWHFDLQLSGTGKTTES